jgi:hypothetical protein
MIMEEFISHLQEGPSVLFLGQNYLRLETGQDVFLSQVMTKYGGEKTSQQYSDIFQEQLSTNPDEVVAWMQRRSAYVPTPKPVQLIAGYYWSGVFTSAFDDVAERALRTEWRPIQPVFDDKYIPAEPRSRRRLNVWYLYGSVSAPDSTGYPPLTREQLWARDGVANIMANRIPELTSLVGTLVIEGYSPRDDWFSSEKMYAVLSRMLPGQAYLFSAPDSVDSDQYLQALIRQNRLITFKDSLAQILLSSHETGRVKLFEPPEEIVFGHQIRINNKKKNLPPGLWTQISETGHLLVESDFLSLQPQNDEKKYSDFRRFLYDSSICPSWIGYARGFAFTRNFENELKENVYKKLQRVPLRRTVTILSGQTGTGKTVALGHLAYEIQKEGQYPVVFIDRCSRLNREYVDHFCEWAEQQGASATLIIWDGAQMPGDYAELLQYFRSRGRNVVLVGSCYVLSQGELTEVDRIDAPASLTTEEAARFGDFLNGIDGGLQAYLTRQTKLNTQSFLVFLYRLLPESRSAIRTGIEQELAFAEGIITVKAADKKVAVELRTTLGEALLQAGLISSLPSLVSEPRDMGGELITELQELIGLVMVPGQFNIACPFDLLLRSLNRRSTTDFLHILKSVDIFRWPDDDSGNITIEPRTALEAQLIVQSRLGGPKYEIDYATKLIKSVRIGQLFERSELDFAVDLIRNIGPNSIKPVYYQNYFLHLAQCLSELRASGVENARLLLQESMLCRESAKLPENQDAMFSLLKQSEDAIEKALDLVKEGPENRYFLSRIHVERASSYGLMATHAKDKESSLLLLKKAHNECYYAHNLDPQNFYPIDVVSWTTRDLLESPDITEQDRVALQVDVMHAFDLADSEGYQGETLARLNGRKEEIFNALAQYSLSDSAFNALLEQGSCIGIYARAQRMIDFIYKNLEYTEDQRMHIKNAYEYLMQFKDKIANDSKCLLLLLRLWWTWKTGQPMATRERSTLAFNEEEWRYVRTLLSQLLKTEELANNLRLKYFEALASFHLNEYTIAIKMFRQLDYESQSYGGRIIKHYLWADSSGLPRRVNGTVSWIDDKGRGEIYVNEIQSRIPFIERDTGKTGGVKRSDAFNNFRIAFSFRGPIVDFREQ